MKRKGSCFTNLTNGMLRKISYAERVLVGQKHHQPGAPNDGFLLNTLKILYTFRCLEMYSKQRYKICICSAILGELESFRSKLHGLVMSIQYFPENVRCNLKYYKSETFSDFSLHCIFGSGTDFRFPFPYEKWPNLRFI